MAVSHWIEHQTGWSIKKFVRSARRYRSVTIQAGKHTLTAAEPPPADIAAALAKIHDLRARTSLVGNDPAPLAHVTTEVLFPLCEHPG